MPSSDCLTRRLKPPDGRGALSLPDVVRPTLGTCQPDVSETCHGTPLNGIPARAQTGWMMATFQRLPVDSFGGDFQSRWAFSVPARFTRLTLVKHNTTAKLWEHSPVKACSD
jgi:hypothetical protein